MGGPRAVLCCLQMFYYAVRRYYLMVYLRLYSEYTDLPNGICVITDNIWGIPWKCAKICVKCGKLILNYG